MKVPPKLAHFISQPGFGLRVFIGFGIASAFVAGMKELFVELARTQDWVLEYREWIAGGSLFIAFLLWIGFVLISRPNETK
jgi:hypothetical protein